MFSPVTGKTKDSTWPSFMQAWWRLCKRSERSTAEPGGALDQDWDILKSKIEGLRSEANGERADKGLAWFQSLYDRRHKWAACWTWSIGNPLYQYMSMAVSVIDTLQNSIFVYTSLLWSAFDSAC